MLDADLAMLSSVDTRELVQAVKRSVSRFPSDFMFQLARDEFARLRSQSVISKPGRGGRRTPPYAFTEQGVAMLSSVLHSERAIEVNVEIMRAFVRLRQLLINEELPKELAVLEKKYDRHGAQFQVVFQATRELMTPQSTKKRPLGFRSDDDDGVRYQRFPIGKFIPCERNLPPTLS